MSRVESYIKLFLNKLGNDLGGLCARMQTIGDGTAVDDID